MKKILVTDDLTVINMGIDIRSKTRLIKEVVSRLEECFKPVCKLHGMNNRDQINITTCVKEALYNAITHGNLEVDSELKKESLELFDKKVKEKEMIEKFSQKKVIVRYHAFSNKIDIQVEDQGKGFDPAKVDFDILEPYGRGIKLIESFMDKVVWNEVGNCIYMTKYLKK